MHEAITIAIPTIIILLTLVWQSNRSDNRFALIETKIDALATALRAEIQASRTEAHVDNNRIADIMQQQGERIARLETHAA